MSVQLTSQSLQAHNVSEKVEAAAFIKHVEGMLGSCG